MKHPSREVNVVKKDTMDKLCSFFFIQTGDLGNEHPSTLKVNSNELEMLPSTLKSLTTTTVY